MLLVIFLSSGLFLGWSLGANDAANVFGTAVATRMVKFKTAATICSIFVVLGACISGAGAAHTLGKLGTINAIPGAFMVALAAAITVYWMTKLALPVSTSQAIVGAIIGWNLFSGSLTNYNSLAKIVSTWALCPLLAGFFSFCYFQALRYFLKKVKIHLFRMDAYLRVGLILVGAFGSYSLGANNIANVMGVFVEVSPFPSIEVFGIFHFSSTQQLFLLGGIAIAVGVYTYSHKVMSTVGQKVFQLNPPAALVVVLAESTVLFLFASQSLESWLISHKLPSIPLVPVSSSQAVIGAVIGIGIAKGGRNIRWKVLGNIALGWVTTPIIAGIVSFFSLFFLQNVFNQQVYIPFHYKITQEVKEQLIKNNLWTQKLEELKGIEFESTQKFISALKHKMDISKSSRELALILKFAKIVSIKIDPYVIYNKLNSNLFTEEQFQAIVLLKNQSFSYEWQFYNALVKKSSSWKKKPSTPENKVYNKNLDEKFRYLLRIFELKNSKK